MSRQSKQAKKKVLAKQFTAMHKSGSKGPSAPKPKHNKVNTFRKGKPTGKQVSYRLYHEESGF